MRPPLTKSQIERLGVRLVHAERPADADLELLHKVVDRRVDPVHGYRAVHVIAFPEGVPVEIQVRTLWQHEWAELFEKLADRVGRRIRYGDPPARWWTPSEFERMDEATRRSTSVAYERRVLTVHVALRAARAIDAIEVAAAIAPDNPELRQARELVDGLLIDLGEILEAL